MRCLACKADVMKESKTTYFQEMNDGYVIIENVPCLKCEQCGEEFITADVSEKIDYILNHLQSNTSKVCVMDYSTAA